MTSRLLRGALAALLALVVGPAWAAPEVGQPAPPLVVREIDGTRFELSAARGHVVIVNFWATWCPPCREEMPALDGFYSRFHDKGILVVGVSMDHARDRKSVIKVGGEVHYPLAIVADAEKNGFGIPAILPVTYIVDPEGVVRTVLTPSSVKVSEDALERAVSPLLPQPG